MGLDMQLVDQYDNELMYWRKANAIHNWFIQNCLDGKDKNDGKKTLITREKLSELLKVCLKVLYDSKRANVYLPVDGYLSSMRDTWYFQDIINTINTIGDILDNDDNEKPIQVYYTSSW